MGRREDFRRILAHRQPENAILDLGGCPLSTMMGKSYAALLRHLGLEDPEAGRHGILKWGQVYRLDDRVLDALDIDTRGVGAVQIPRSSTYRVLSPTEYIDEWGIRRRFTGLYWDIVESPLRGRSVEDLDGFPWPDPDSIDLDSVRREAARAKWLYENTDYILVADLPTYGIFELGCWICGFEDYLCKMAEEPEFIHAFSARVLSYQKRVLQLYLEELGPYIHLVVSGDDFATQRSQFLSAGMFREMVKPYFQERLRHTREFTDAAILHHSCGSVADLIPDLIECGVEVLNPVQPGAAGMEPETVKRRYGDRIVFHGGFDTQEVLPFGTPADVEAAVGQIMRVLNQNGGYLFAAAHNIQEDVPPENVVTMFRAARRYGKKQYFDANAAW